MNGEFRSDFNIAIPKELKYAPKRLGLIFYLLAH